MIRATVSTLESPSRPERERFAGLEKTIAAHDAVMAQLPGLNAIEIGGAPSSTQALALPLTVAAWNVERCLFPAETAQHLAREKPSLVLLSEVDLGMARTGQRHTTREIALDLGMEYAYGVEFVELGLGSAVEREFCRDDHNAQGFHGNALMAACPLRDPFLLRLAGERLWFVSSKEEPRIGERCAIGAIVDTDAGPFLAVSIHLESACPALYRQRQIEGLIAAIDRHHPGMPVLIGGDLNTGNHAGGDFDAEGLFVIAARHGFARHGGPIDAMTTRPSLITRWPERAMKLDWFLSRGMRIGKSRIVPSLDPAGRPLSDHDLIVCVVEGIDRRSFR